MKWIISLLLLFSIGCSSIHLGGGATSDGWSTELSGYSHEADGGMKIIGIRGSVGQERLPIDWEHPSTNRVAIGGFTQIQLCKGFYLEPRLDIVYYNNLDTPWEPEFGIRLGYRYKKFSAYIGVRHPLGNGDRHELMGEYSHIPDGWKPEGGLFFSYDF